MAYNLFEAMLGSVAFSSLSGKEDELVLVDIVEEEAKMDTQTVPLGLKSGMMRTVNRRKSLSVKLKFCIRTQDVERRAALRDAVAAWAAKGGALKTNTRPGKILDVVADVPPALASSGKWTDELELTLTAYEIPYWQSEKMTSVSFFAQPLDSGGYWIADLINPDGNAGEAELNAMIYHIGTGPLTRMKITCGDTFFEFDGLDIQPDSVITITYESGILSVLDFTQLEGDNSLLKYRTAESSDDLIATSGVDNQLIIEADQQLKGNIYTRGRWL